MLTLAIGVIASAIASIGAFRYAFGIVRRGTQPRFSSWLTWTVSWLVLFFIAMSSKNYLAAAFAAAGALRSATVSVLTLYKGHHRKSDGFDTACIISASACMFVFATTPHESIAGAVLAGAANWIATLPTLRQAWSSPFADDMRVYATNVVACLLVLSSIAYEDQLMTVGSFGPIVSLVGNGVIVLLIATRRRFQGRTVVMAS